MPTQKAGIGFLTIGSAGAEENLAGITSVSLSGDKGYIDVIDGTTLNEKGNTIADKVAGQETLGGSLELNHRVDDTGTLEATQATLFDAYQNETELRAVIEFAEGRLYEIPIVLTNWDFDATIDGGSIMTKSYDFAATDAMISYTPAV